MKSSTRHKLIFAASLVGCCLAIVFWNATRLLARSDMLDEPSRSQANTLLRIISLESVRGPIDAFQKWLHQDFEGAPNATVTIRQPLQTASEPTETYSQIVVEPAAVLQKDSQTLPLPIPLTPVSKAESSKSVTTFTEPLHDKAPLVLLNQKLPDIPPGIAPMEGVIIFAGDSLSMGYAAAAQSLLPARGHLSSYNAGRISTGLTATAYYNWPEHIDELCRSKSPTAFVFSFGANDLIDLKQDGKYLRFGSSEWQAAYRLRALNAVTLAKSCGAKVAWMKLPPMRDLAFENKMKSLRLAQEEACAVSDACVDPFSGLGMAEQQFTEQLSLNGKATLLRAQDGIHMAPYGYRLASERALRLLGATR